MRSSEIDSDIAVIGAGPAGLLAGHETNPDRYGIETNVFTKNEIVGLPPHCSGLISYEGLQKLNLNMQDIKHKIGYNLIERARFVGPANSFFEIDRGPQSMVVIDRPALDQYLAERMIKRGCKLHSGHKIVKIKNKKGIWHLLIKNNKDYITQKTRILINAEGIPSRLAESVGYPVPNKNWLFPAYQADFEGVLDLETDCSELYFGQEFAPGFFGWVIPIGEDSARVGLAIGSWMSGKTRRFFHRFIKKHPALKKRFKDKKIVRSYGGIVPASGPISCTYNHNYMVVGDAAGQSKATTGGGVNIGGFCGRLSGKYARKIILEEVLATKGCGDYQKQWEANFEPNLTLMKLLRRSISFLPDNTWNDIISIGKVTDISDTMRTSNIDLHGIKLLQYSLQPRVFQKGLHIIPYLLRSLLQGFLI